MAFDPRLLSPLFYANGATTWLYRTRTEGVAAVGAGYFDTASARLRAADWILLDATDGGRVLAVTAVAPGAVTVAPGLTGGTLPASPILTIDTPAGQSAGAPFTVAVTGTYGGGNAGAVEVARSTDGGLSWSGWEILVAAASGGAYAGTTVFTAASGNCRVRARMDGIVATSGVFALNAAGSGQQQGETTTVSGVADSTANANAGGLGNNELTLNQGLYNLRADDTARITAANGAVSLWSSGQSLPGRAVQNTPANQPAHAAADTLVTFNSTGQTDADADWLNLPELAARYSNNTGSKLGVAYLLVRFRGLPGGSDTFPFFRIGANNPSFNQIGRRTVYATANASRITIVRGDATSQAVGSNLPLPQIGEWIAVAVVVNDDRSVAGTSDNVSRLFIKSRTGGTYATMATTGTGAPKVISWDPSSTATINRSVFGGSVSEGSGPIDLRAFAFDLAPPVTNAAIEANLDKLLARV